LIIWAIGVNAENNLNLYLFWGNGCPHCAKEKSFLSDILPKYPTVKLNSYEIYNNQDNVQLMQRVADKLNVNASGVPFLIIGDKEFIGFAEGTTDEAIQDRITKCLSSSCPDSIASIVGNNSVYPNQNTNPPPQNQTQDTEPKVKQKIVKLPIIGEIDALNYSLPAFTIILGTLDGFNPCAMWTLLFLISLLLGFKDRKKMWLFGGVFILASAFVYFLFMAAWLKLILFIGFVIWVRLAIGLVALVGGGYSFKKGLSNKDGGCEITGDEKRQKTFSRLRELVKQKNIFIALAGLVILAFAVNLVELICSAGLPAVYTQVLALNDLATWQYYGYLSLYIFFFMLDDLIIFALAMITLQMTGLSTKYSRYSNLIGGLLMIIIGLMLIFRPEWLMFG
jgi:glutaredoxin